MNNRSIAGVNRDVKTDDCASAGEAEVGKPVGNPAEIRHRTSREGGRKQDMIQGNARRKLYEYVVEEIGRKIVHGDFEAGDTLPNEDALCREFGVSRGVLREATKVLTQKGLIVARPKRGTAVQPNSEWNLFDADVLLWKLVGGNTAEFFRDVTEVRRIVESESARLTACRADEEEMRMIEDLYRKMAVTLRDPSSYDYESYLLIDMRFHTAIMDASHNPLLAQIGHTMRRAVHAARRMDIRDIKVQQESLHFHAAIVDAIVHRDAETAYEASQALFDQVQQPLR
ncbi:MAG: FadR/GntR family transcriptional regulator [Desulfobacterales bacterium]